MTHDQAVVALDWLVRVRPATWLVAAGLPDASDALLRCPPVRGPDDVHPRLTDVVRRCASPTRQARDAAVAAVRDARDRSTSPAALEVWGALADATWSATSLAARSHIVPAAHAAGIDPGRALMRTAALGAASITPSRPHTTDLRPRPADWDPIWVVAADAACVVAWTAVAQLALADAPIWRSPALDAWVEADATARNALE